MGKVKKLFYSWLHPEKPKDWQDWLIEIIEIRILLPLSVITFGLIIPICVVCIYGFNAGYIMASLLIGSGVNILFCIINPVCSCINLSKC